MQTPSNETTPAESTAYQPSPRPGLTLTALLVVIIVVLVGLLAQSGQDEVRALLGRSDSPESNDAHKSKNASRVSLDDDGETIVTLPKDAQIASGIETSEIKAITQASGQAVFATVTNLHSLFELRARYQASLADIRAARAALHRSSAELQRLRTLHADDRNVSRSAVEQMAALQAADAAKLAQLQNSASASLEATRQAWGLQLAALLLEADKSPGLMRLSQREEIVLQVGFGKSFTGGTAPAELLVSAADGAKSQTATLIGGAIQTDPLLGNATYFYKTAMGDLRVGARLRVSVPGVVNGTLVPFDAVVWHGGKAWAYVIEGEDKRGTKFERRLVSTRDEIEQGWINSKNFKDGERVVTSGAQLLLSEELRKSTVDDD